jgi:hypothetical protein
MHTHIYIYCLIHTHTHAVTAQLPEAQGGLSGAALVVSTEGEFNASERLAAFVSATQDRLGAEVAELDFLNNVVGAFFSILECI